VRAGGRKFSHAVMAQIRRAVDFPGGNWIRSRVLCRTGSLKLVLGCGDRARCGGFTYCTGVTALNASASRDRLLFLPVNRASTNPPRKLMR
jgi:hypothetical protein